MKALRCGAVLIAVLLPAPLVPPAQAADEVYPDVTLDATLDPVARRLRATAELEVPAAYRFVLHESLDVTAISVNGRQIADLTPRRRGRLREWHIANAAPASLRIEYGGVLPPLDRNLDHRSVLRIDEPMLSEDGGFLPAGAAWYPAPRGLFSYRVTLSLPALQRGLVAGRLAKEDLPPDSTGRYTASFEMNRPAEGIDLMTGPYRVRESILPRAGAEPVRLRTYFYAGMEALSPSYLEDSRRYIELYALLIGAYPFTEFSVVASPLPTGFGMPTLTYLGAEVLKLPFIRETSLGHEILHNWWGNGVYPDYAKGNWSEGLTTFMADYAYKERESPAAAREMRLAWLRDFAAIPEGRHETLASFRSRTHGAAAAVGYGKSAMVFFMLRDLIGEDAFREGVRLFWSRHQFRLASWDDVRAAFEAAARRDLAQFFEQWLKRAGGPDLRIRSAAARRAGDSVSMVLELEQHPPYALSVPIEFARGARSESRRVAIEREHQTVTLELDATPDIVRLDPDLRLWRRLGAAELPPILRQWIIARAPAYAVVSASPDVQRIAGALARRFFEQPAKPVKVQQIQGIKEPTLIIGLHQDVDRMLEQLGLPARPTLLSGKGSAAAWTVDADRASTRARVAVISARDAASLEALLRPLPHYGAQSYLIFDGARMIERGVWTAAGAATRVTVKGEGTTGSRERGAESGER